MRINKKIAGGVAAGVVLVAGVGTAWAYWSSTGTGNGSATTGTSSSFAVSVDNLNLANLTPGGPSDTVHYTVANNGSGAQNLTQVVVKVDPTWAAKADATKPACTAADFKIGSAAAGASFTDVAIAKELAAGTSNSSSAALQMVDNATANQDNCQGVTVPLIVNAG